MSNNKNNLIVSAKERIKNINFIRAVSVRLFKRYQAIRNDDLDRRRIVNLQNAILNKLSSKDKIVVAFLVHTPAKWQYEGIYRLMQNHSRYEPWVVPIPCHNNYSMPNMADLHKTKMYFAAYKVFDVVDKSGRLLDLNRSLQPDIIFFAEQPGNHTLYNIYRFYEHSLCCYVPYGYTVSRNYERFFNLPFFRMLWASFAETDMHVAMARKYNVDGGVHFVHTGYPAMDDFSVNSNLLGDSWARAQPKHKRLIWAPHNFIESNNSPASFLLYHEFMLEIANNYKDELFITFKPHPLLKQKLYSLKSWGKARADAYYNKWANMDNTQLAEQDYIGLFLGSDALLHDSLSYTAEYLFVNKPVCFIYKRNDITNYFNEFGQQALDVAYKSFNADDILGFINLVVIGGQDTLQFKRSKFVSDCLLPPNHTPAATNVLNNIDSAIRQL